MTISTDPAIYVDNRLFLGRVREQREFRNLLREVLAERDADALPFVVLLYGDGGIGKTTLSKRLWDIARLEQPFEGEFESLRIDWEEERRRHPDLSVGRERIDSVTVFDALHQAAIRHEWGRHFAAYAKARSQQAEAAQAAAQALGAELGEALASVRGLSATAIVKLVRMQAPVIGNTGEEWVKAAADFGLKVSIEQGVKLYGSLRQQLQARMRPELYSLYLDPEEQLALALGQGLREVAKRKRLVLVLDTYEIVDVADPWLRLAMKAAGARLVWIVSGRNDLARSRQFGKHYLLGYESEFGTRLLAYNLPELALADVRAYFADRVPKRPLEDETAQAISRATRGIPLALVEAAEMWAKGCSLAEIDGDDGQPVAAGEIVGQMTARYLLHVVAEADRQALYALALAGGDREMLAAMLRPAGETDNHFDLAGEVARLQRLYASVHLDEARLHDEPSDFLRAHLRQPNQRHSPALRELHTRSVAALQARLGEATLELPRIEDRCEDPDWVADALRLADHHFALDEGEGWRWLIPRFVEGLAYSSTLRSGLVQVAKGWRTQLSRRGQARLAALEKGSGFLANPEQEEEMLTALGRVPDWLTGEGEDERRVILTWKRGQMLTRRGGYTEAVDRLESAPRALPDGVERLRGLLGEAMNELAGKLMWPDDASGAQYSQQAERLLEQVVTWLPEKQYGWYNLGCVQ